MSEIAFVLNGSPRTVDVAADTPLLWVLRDTLGLTGTKYGCGIAQCGACTVHVDGEATRSCVTEVGSVRGKRITTIEGLGSAGRHAVQQAWVDEQVPQCGYCQSGMLMTAAELLSRKPQPGDADVDAAFAGHICRCGTYPRIRRAVRRAAELLGKGGAK
jgi:aerobic-type carbon monoxide dehydrogenase small subunit (CoxS/CutS family)